MIPAILRVARASSQRAPGSQPRYLNRPLRHINDHVTVIGHDERASLACLLARGVERVGTARVLALSPVLRAKIVRASGLTGSKGRIPTFAAFGERSRRDWSIQDVGIHQEAGGR